MSKTLYQYRDTFIDDNGKRHDIKAHTKHELLEKMERAKANARKGLHVQNGMTVDAWSKICFEKYRTRAQENTLRNEIWRFDKHVGGQIGHRKLKDVRPLECQNVLNKAAESGLSDYMIKQIYQLMRFVFAMAEENGLIERTPVRAITIPKGKSEQPRRALTAEEDRYFFQACEQNSQYVFFLVMRLCGLRNKEVSDLRGTDIRQIQGEWFIHVQGSKTAYSERLVPCPTYLFDRLPKPSNPFDYLFQNQNGRQMLKQNQRRVWASLTKTMQILAGCRTYKGALVSPYPLATDLTSYDLRHSYCTDLARDGVDLRTAQRLMGHADLSMISRTYTHVDDGMLIAEAQRINLKYQNAPEEYGKLVKIKGNVETCVETNA